MANKAPRDLSRDIVSTLHELIDKTVGAAVDHSRVISFSDLRDDLEQLEGTLKRLQQLVDLEVYQGEAEQKGYTQADKAAVQAGITARLATIPGELAKKGIYTYKIAAEDEWTMIPPDTSDRA